MRRKTTAAEHPIEAKICACHSIGQLERLAGIPDTHADRFAFWIQFKDLPSGEHLDTGVRELKRRIRAEAAGP